MLKQSTTIEPAAQRRRRYAIREGRSVQPMAAAPWHHCASGRTLGEPLI
jgi:hypothetical protein